MGRQRGYLEQIQQVSARFAGLASQQVSGGIGQRRFHAFGVVFAGGRLLQSKTDVHGKDSSAGAEARIFFIGACGPAEAVP